MNVSDSKSTIYNFLLMGSMAVFLTVCEVFLSTKVENGRFRPLYCDWRPLAEKRPPQHISLKSTFSWLQQYGAIFICLAVVASQSCERNHAKFRENSNLYQFKVCQDYRPWFQSKSVCNFQLVINIVTLDVFRTIFEVLTYITIENNLFLHPTIVWRLAQGNPLEFMDETNPATLERWDYCTSKIALS